MRRYESLNGLRAIAALGIVLMHVRATVNVDVTGNFLYDAIIPAMSDFVFLFMMVSAFSLCCGYYERFKNGNIVLNDFYKKRYMRILPFFSILVLLSAAIPHAPNKAGLAMASKSFLGSSGLSEGAEKAIESLTELTLGYGLLPNPSLTIMGVGWFLGVIFLFYMLFPFFVFMIDNKRRAWVSLIVTHVLCFFCIIYFFSEKFVGFKAVPKSFLYNVPFFVLGGIIYLYRNDLERCVNGGGKKYMLLFLCIGVTIYYWMCADLKFTYLGVLVKSLVMGAWLVFAVVTKTILLHNRIIDYLSGVSMEIYLSHMMCFRAVQFLHISNYVDNVDMVYWLTYVLTVIVAIVFSHIVKYILLPETSSLIEKIKK